MQGAAFGAQFGLVGGVVGAVAGGLIGFFAGSKFRKIAKDAGKVLGEGLSKETISKIEEDSKKLKISIQKASLLNISTAIADTGKAAATFGPQINDLIKGIADKSIPAKEGLAELAQTFAAVADEALKAGKVGDKTLVGIIKQARASGVESPEIKAFVAQELDKAVAGFDKFAALFKKLTKDEIGKLGAEADKAFAGLSDTAVKKLADNTGVIFGAVFNALVSEKGIVGAVDQLKGSFETLRERLTDTLGEAEVNRILGPFGAAFDTIGNEKLRPLFEGIDGLSQTMQGLANSAFLTTDQFSAMQQATGTLFDEAIAGGADMKTALQAVAPSIQAAIKAAEQFGVPLDADTERLKKLAEENGIAFKTDPQQVMLDVLVSIAEVLGAEIPESAKKARLALEALKDAAPGEIQVTGGGGAAGGTEGPRAVQANVTVNMGINENPMAAADTAAAMRRQTVEWAAEAIEDRVRKGAARMISLYDRDGLPVSIQRVTAG
jgi:gas vesicle protein